MDHAALNTADAEAMRKYLAAKGWKAPASVRKLRMEAKLFAVTDPEGNRIQFVQPAANAKVDAPKAIGHHIIHVGFLVHSREKEDTFYREVLGFRPYWWGGMTDAKVDWVSQQVPDGHDWMEYMLSGGPGEGIPAGMSQHTLGVLDHFSIGQDSVDTAYKTLKDAGRLEGVQCDKGTEDRQGRQGPVQHVRSRRDPLGADELPRHREALLLSVHRRRPGTVRYPMRFFLALVLIGGLAAAQAQKLSPKWEELTAGDFVQAIHQSQGVCVLPFGILEKHGPHLPIGTDLLDVRYAVMNAVQQEYAVVFPEYYFGQIFEAQQEPGTIAYSLATQLTLLQETVKEMARNGCKKIVIVNGHGGNNSLLPLFAQAQLATPRDYVVYVVGLPTRSVPGRPAMKSDPKTTCTPARPKPRPC